MNSGKDLFKKIKDKTDPTKMLLGMVESMIPKMKEGMDKEAEELLQPGEDKLAYVITEVKGELKMMVCPMVFDKDLGKMVIPRTIRTGSITELLSKSNG